MDTFTFTHLFARVSLGGLRLELHARRAPRLMRNAKSEAPSKERKVFRFSVNLSPPAPPARLARGSHGAREAGARVALRLPSKRCERSNAFFTKAQNKGYSRCSDCVEFYMFQHESKSCWLSTLPASAFALWGMPSDFAWLARAIGPVRVA